MPSLPPLAITVSTERWPLREPFVISRGGRTEITVVVVTVSDGTVTGRGEAVPYTRYAESVAGVVAEIEAQAEWLAKGPSREALLRHMFAAGAARNALDCALWDYEAKRTGLRAAEIAGVPLAPLTTCLTLSLDSPETMARKAQQATAYDTLKLKLGGRDGPEADIARMAAVRAARPDATLLADVNEGWQPASLPRLLAAAAEHGLALVEQPLPQGEDACLADIPHPVPLCADESVHTRLDLPLLRGRYEAVNLKLDKAGGLTEALEMLAMARALDFQIMVGCMMATSLALAPAHLLAQGADFVDLDAPLFLAKDRPHGLDYAGAQVFPPSPQLWG